MQTHFCADMIQCFHLKMGRPHLCFEPGLDANGATALIDRSDRSENACKTEESIYGQQLFVAQHFGIRRRNVRS